MLQIFDVVFRSILAFFLLLIGLAALIGGLRKSPNPFFWLKPDRTTYLKTPMHYVLFGCGCLLVVIWWAYKLVVIYRLL